jgi:hypothetical protein
MVRAAGPVGVSVHGENDDTDGLIRCSSCGEHHIPSVVSDLGRFRSDDGFPLLLNQIENWNSPFGSGSTPTGNTPDQPWSQPNFPVSGFDAGWQSHMIQTLASSEDSKGGSAQTSPIQSNSQGLEGFFAGATPNHG